MYQFKVLLKQDEEGGYVVMVPSLPGCVTYGETFDEAMDMAKDAIEGCVQVMEDEGLEISDDSGMVESSIRIPSRLVPISLSSPFQYA